MAGGRRRRDPRAGPFAAAWAAAVAALALAAGAAGAAFPCQVQVKGRQRGDPECTKTVWRIPKAEARRLGLRRRTVFRSCPSKRAQRRARRGKAQLAAGGLPGGDDKVLAGFEESSVAKNGYLWSAVTYDDAGAPTRSVMRDAESTLIFAERAPAEAANAAAKRGRRRGTGMMCRTGTDEVRMPGVKRLGLHKPEDLPGSDGRARAAFGAGAPVAATCAGDVTPQVKVLYELDSYFVKDSRGGCVSDDAACVAAAVADATDLTNLAAAEYLLQAGVELINEVFVDTVESPTGATYPGRNADKISDNFNQKWFANPRLKEKMADFGVVHLLSGYKLRSGTIGIAWVSSACQGLRAGDYAVAVSWLNLLDDGPDACKVALIMHENGHTFSLDHVGDEEAVMYGFDAPTCSLTFKTAVVDEPGYVRDGETQNARAQIKGYVENHVGQGLGCTCATSTAPSPPPAVAALALAAGAAGAPGAAFP